MRLALGFLLLVKIWSYIGIEWFCWATNALVMLSLCVSVDLEWFCWARNLLLVRIRSWFYEAAGWCPSDPSQWRGDLRLWNVLCPDRKRKVSALSRPCHGRGRAISFLRSEVRLAIVRTKCCQQRVEIRVRLGSGPARNLGVPHSLTHTLTHTDTHWHTRAHTSGGCWLK